MSPRRKISTTIYITPEQNDLLKVMYARNKVPIAEYIRQGVDLIIAKHAAQLAEQLGVPLQDPDADLADAIEQPRTPTDEEQAAKRQSDTIAYLRKLANDEQG